MRDYRLYLKDIISAMESIENFIKGMDFAQFQADDKTASAVMRKLEIIGEAAKHIPQEVRTGGTDRRYGKSIPGSPGVRWQG